MRIDPHPEPRQSPLRDLRNGLEFTAVVTEWLALAARPVELVPRAVATEAPSPVPTSLDEGVRPEGSMARHRVLLRQMNLANESVTPQAANSEPAMSTKAEPSPEPAGVSGEPRSAAGRANAERAPSAGVSRELTQSARENPSLDSSKANDDGRSFPTVFAAPPREPVVGVKDPEATDFREPDRTHEAHDRTGKPLASRNGQMDESAAPPAPPAPPIVNTGAEGAGTLNQDSSAGGSLQAEPSDAQRPLAFAAREAEAIARARWRAPVAGGRQTEVELSHPLFGSLSLSFETFAGGIDVVVTAQDQRAAARLRRDETTLRSILRREHGVELRRYDIRTSDRRRDTDQSPRLRRRGSHLSREA